MMTLSSSHRLLLSMICFQNSVGFESDEARLTKNILADYDKDIRPYTTLEGNRTVVGLGMFLSQIISVNEKEQELATSVYMSHTWTDPRLQWNKSDYGDIAIHRFLSDDIWTPRVILQNSKDGEFDVSLRVETLVYSDGKVEWLPPALYKSSCSIEVSLFPFDWQNCTLSFQLTSYDKSEIELTLTGDEITVDCNSFQPNGEWDLIQRPVKLISHIRNGLEYQNVEFYFIIQRRPQFYVMNLIVPCILLTLISCFVFFLPAVSCEKMTLSISVLLGEAVFLFLIAQRMPETSLSVPLIAGYLLFTMFLVIASVVFSVVVCNIHYRSSTTHVMPAWQRIVFIEILAPLLKVERPNDNNGNKEKNGSWRSGQYQSNELIPLQSPSETIFNRQATRFGFQQRRIRRDDGNIEVTGVSSGRAALHSIPAPLKPLPAQLKEIVNNITYLSSSIKQDQIEEQSADEWAYVALILDRLLFWIYLAVFVFGTMGFFLKTTTADYPAAQSSLVC